MNKKKAPRKTLKQKLAEAAAGKHPGGRPSAKDKVNLDQVEVIASLGLIDEEIAVILGIQKSTLNNWKKDPKFMDSLKRGKLKADFQVTKSLFNKALGKRIVLEQTKDGPVEKTILVEPDTSACIFWLKNRRSDIWRDKQDHNHSGEVKGGGATVINVITAVPRPDIQAKN